MKINDWNIFEKWSSERLLVIGIASAILASLSAYFLKGRFDGVLDLHFVENIQFYQPFLDNFIAIFLLTLSLFFTSKLLNSKTRFVDLLNAVLVGRISIYLILLTNINGFIGRLSEQLLIDPENIQIDSNTILLIGIGMISLVFLSIFLCVVYVGFRVATNYKNWKGFLYFILTVMVAEILSIILYSTIL